MNLSVTSSGSRRGFFLRGVSLKEFLLPIVDDGQYINPLPF